MNVYRLCAVGAALLCSGLPAGAVTFSESGDAGESLATANVVAGAVGSGGTNAIAGNIAEAFSDADLFRLSLVAGTTFSAVVSATSTGLDDSQLFLFSATGLGLVANDDISTTNFFSSISFNVATSGTYYLGISGYNYDPRDAASYIFPDTQLGQVSALPGAGSLNSWAARTPNPVSFGNYTIALATTPVPEPSSVFGLVVLAGCGAAVLGRRGRQPG